MPGNIVYCGPKFQIEFARLRDGTVPGLDFLNAQDPKWQARMHALFERMGDIGTIHNREQFKKIEKTPFFEFKSFQMRMPCYFRSDRRVVITHGFIKKDDKIKRGDLERATHIKQEYEEFLSEISRKGERLQ